MIKSEIHGKRCLFSSACRIQGDFIRLLFFSALIGKPDILVIMENTQDIIIQSDLIALFRNLFSAVRQKTIIRKCQRLCVTQIVYLWNSGFPHNYNH